MIILNIDDGSSLSIVAGVAVGISCLHRLQRQSFSAQGFAQLKLPINDDVGVVAGDQDRSCAVVGAQADLQSIENDHCGVEIEADVHRGIINQVYSLLHARDLVWG